MRSIKVVGMLQLGLLLVLFILAGCAGVNRSDSNPPDPEGGISGTGHGLKCPEQGRKKPKHCMEAP